MRSSSNGHRVVGCAGGLLDRHGGDGGRAGPARIATEGAAVISLEILYGFGALVAVILFAYLVFALICAEEF